MSEFEPIGQEASFLGHVGGIESRRMADGVELRLKLASHHLNPNGTVHGGVILTLFDITLGLTVEQSLQGALDGHPITVQLSTSMIGAASAGETLIGTAQVDASTRTTSFVSGRIRCGSRVIATASAVFRNPKPAG